MSQLSSLEIRKTQLNIEISSYTTQIQTQTEQKKRITENQIRGLNTQLVGITNQINALNKSLDNYNKNILPKTQAYIQKTFYDKPTDSTKPDYSSYFTEEKKNELIRRSNNAAEIPQIESFQETMAPSKWDIGVM
jgi:predicted  nucleic acid-binding Zn-ribbon protein